MTLGLLAVLCIASGSVQASTWTGGMLYDRFGVTLSIGEHEFEPGKSVYKFSNSWAPTTALSHPLAQIYYTVNDFYGWPSDGSVYGEAPEPQYSGGTVINDWKGYTDPTWPQGGEMYDTEAYYMTNDEHNIYLAIVTSTPPPPGFQFVDLFDPVLVATGDLAIHTDLGEYWYGVDVNLADRGADEFASPPLPTDIGQGLYKTEGAARWYTTNLDGAVQAGDFPDTNFYGGGMPERYVQDIVVKYLQTGLQEGYDPGESLDTGMYSTWEVNFTIPLSAIGYDDLLRGESREIAFQILSGCRNDGNDEKFALRLEGEVHAVPEPGTLALTALGLLGLAYLKRRRDGMAAAD